MAHDIMDPEKPRARKLEDAGRIMGISRPYIYKLAKLGKIKLLKIGGVSVILETEIDRILENGVQLDDAP
jgi:hypothetical protein